MPLEEEQVGEEEEGEGEQGVVVQVRPPEGGRWKEHLGRSTYR